MSTFEAKTNDQLIDILKKVVTVLVTRGVQSAGLFYQDDQFHAVGHRPICKFNIDNAHIWEEAPGFHIDHEVHVQTKLPDPPNLLTMTYKSGNQWWRKWSRHFLGYFPGYADPLKKPSWWPIEWSDHKNRTKNKFDILKIIAALYLHYENIVLDLPPEANQTLVVATGSTQTTSGQSEASGSTQAIMLTSPGQNAESVSTPGLDQVSMEPIIDVETIDPEDQPSVSSLIVPIQDTMELHPVANGQIINTSIQLQTLASAQVVEIATKEQHPPSSVSSQPIIPQDDSTSDWWSSTPLPIGPTAVCVSEQGLTPAEPKPLPPDRPKRKINQREELQARKRNTVGKKNKK